MTAEVVIMNKNAVAMAADSAVTVNGKTFNTANKLFALADFIPIGIMIYNNAEFVGIPVEILIKQFRKQTLSSKSYENLDQCAKSLIEYFSTAGVNLSKKNHQNFLIMHTMQIFSYLLNSFINNTQQDKLSSENLAVHIELQIEQLLNAQFNENLKGIDILRITSEISESAEAIAKAVISKTFHHLLTKDNIKLLIDASIETVTRDVNQQSYVGIVIAGFGTYDLFPKLYSFRIDGVFGEKLKWKELEKSEINFEETSYLNAFAQTDMVYLFKNGIHPELDNALFEELDGLQKKIVQSFSNIAQIKPPESEAFEKQFTTHREELVKNLQAVIKERFLQNINMGISVLHHEDLAKAAETLVNLHGFRQRVSHEQETVGGPIDVAVITKGDGLIWIKRKHYFNPALNVNYFLSKLSAIMVSEGKIDDKE